MDSELQKKLERRRQLNEAKEKTSETSTARPVAARTEDHGECIELEWHPPNLGLQDNIKGS